MNITYKGTKMTTNEIIKYCKYISEVLKANQLSGKLHDIVLKNNIILQKHSIKYYKFTNIMEKLDVIQITTLPNNQMNLAGKFRIDNNNLNILYCLSLAINSLEEKTILKMYRNRYKIDVFELIYKKIQYCLKRHKPLHLIAKSIKNLNNTYKSIIEEIIIKYYQYTQIILQDISKFLSHIQQPISFVTYYYPDIFSTDSIHLINIKYIKQISNTTYNMCIINNTAPKICGYESLAHCLYDYSKMDIVNISENDKLYGDLYSFFKKTVNVCTLKDIFIPDDISTFYDNKCIERAYETYLRNNCPMIKEICNEIININQQINSKGNYQFKINTRVHGNKKKRLSVSGRQYNPLCSIKKSERKILLEKEGFDIEIDLHSAIFSITRFLNTREIDLDYDIKKKIMELNINDIYGNPITKTQIKSLLFRIFFSNSQKEALKNYHNKDNSFLLHRDLIDTDSIKELPNITDDDFTKIYNLVMSEIKDNKDYQKTIFIIESIAEANIINTFLSMHIEIENVYDCFWFKTTQISEVEAKRIITERMIISLSFCKDYFLNDYYTEITQQINSLCLNKSISTQNDTSNNFLIAS